ncbi:polymer-forming cytoskeletal protein [bacterium C-53]|nr:polymer-forming cytoskeletal protein [Lachnospiraceae bacterium]NBI02175.1 polymer-forming cytoskeletal protein [Lachnospiraceae bacterium]RKJ10456.1 polymer-forming cytoskeletal protein [bacterium C-53]
MESEVIEPAVELPEVKISEELRLEELAAGILPRNENRQKMSPGGPDSIIMERNQEENMRQEEMNEETMEGAVEMENEMTTETAVEEKNEVTTDEASGLGDGPATDENGVITEGMTIHGDISSMGSMEVLGKIVGNIELRGKLNISGTINGNSKAAEIFADSAKITGEIVSDGSVKVGQSSIIVGNITAQSAVIAGAVKGDIDVHGPVILDTSAIVMGDIKSKSVQINNGAVIEGRCSQCYADVSPISFFNDLK